MSRLDSRFRRLEERFAPLGDASDRAMNEAIERLDHTNLVVLYEGFERLGLEGLIGFEEVRPLLTEDEVAALDRLGELHDQILEERRWGG